MLNPLDKLELHSENIQEILNDPPNWLIQWGITVVIIVILALISSSWFIKYSDFINARIIITTENAPVKLEAKIAGEIKEIFVANKEKVAKNQILLILESSANYRDIRKLIEIIDSIKYNQEELKFPIEVTNKFNLGDITIPYSDFEKSYMEYRLDRRFNPLYFEISGIKKTLNELTSQLNILNSQSYTGSLELQLIKEDLERQKKLFTESAISELEFEKKKIEYLQAERLYGSTNLLYSQLKQEIILAQVKLKDIEIKLVKEKAVVENNVLLTLNQLKRSIREWELKYVLKSPINGIVNFQNYWQESKTVKPNDVIISIFPNINNNLLGRLVLPSKNVGKVKEGQRVLIKLDNYPFEEFGLVEGEVKDISSTIDKDNFYYVEVQLKLPLITTYNKEIDFVRELQGTAEIITEELRLADRFFYGYRKLLNRI